MRPRPYHIGMIRKPLLTRFNANYTRDENGCWLWTGTTTNGKYGHRPYGQIRHDGTPIYAHRAAWTLFWGEIPSGSLVLHHCDVSLCVNPRHLFLGSYMDNRNDMLAKGRDNPSRGTEHYLAKLTEDEVRTIFTLRRKEPLQETARRFKINKSHVSRIQGGYAWKHLGLSR